MPREARTAKERLASPVRWLRWPVLVVATLALGGIIALPPLSRARLESALEEALSLEVSVDRIRPSFTAARIDLSRISVASPPGFPPADAIRLDGIRVPCPPTVFLAKAIEADQVTVQELRVTLSERSGDAPAQEPGRVSLEEIVDRGLRPDTSPGEGYRFRLGRVSFLSVRVDVPASMHGSGEASVVTLPSWAFDLSDTDLSLHALARRFLAEIATMLVASQNPIYLSLTEDAEARCREVARSAQRASPTNGTEASGAPAAAPGS